MKGRYAPGAYTKAKERIAELEAELAAMEASLEWEARLKWEQKLVLQREEQKARAEKAEAEVERLRDALESIRSARRTDSRSIEIARMALGVNPSGDTLGKERDDG